KVRTETTTPTTMTTTATMVAIRTTTMEATATMGTVATMIAKAIMANTAEPPIRASATTTIRKATHLYPSRVRGGVDRSGPARSAERSSGEMQGTDWRQRRRRTRSG